MAKRKHPFDVVAEQLEALAAQPAAAQDASPDFWECEVAADDQAEMCDPPSVVLTWGPEKGLGPDGFPRVPIPEMRQKGTSRWTDVMSTNLPWREGYLLNEKAVALFKRFELGAVREYPVTVHDRKGGARTLSYLLVRNEIPPSSVDFPRSEFYLADMVGIPKAPVAITSFEDWSEKGGLARKRQLDSCEKFSKLPFRKLLFRPGHAPGVDLFTLGRLAITVFVSTRLKEAVVESGITGLEMRPNKRVFVGGAD